MKSRFFLLLNLILLLSFESYCQVFEESLAQDISYPFLDKLIEIAKNNYPKVKSNIAKIAAADANIQRARRGYYDIISFSFLYSPQQTTTLINPNFLNGYQFGLVLNLGNLLQKPTQLKQAKEEYNTVVYDKIAYDLNLEAEVKQRYFTYIQQMAVLKIKRQTLVDLEASVKYMKYKFEKGEETLHEYNQIIVTYTNYIQTKLVSESEALTAKAKLEELIGQKLEDVKIEPSK
ncbi:MAG: TolC family protein [Siphonobacter sp.]